MLKHAKPTRLRRHIGIAALTLLVCLPAARRGWSWRAAVVGAAYAATLVLFVLANRLTTAANTIFLQSTAPLYLLLLGPWLLHEPVRRPLGPQVGAKGFGLAPPGPAGQPGRPAESLCAHGPIQRQGVEQRQADIPRRPGDQDFHAQRR